eukprot:9499373-Pyramimonas_sp.AAC.2
MTDPSHVCTLSRLTGECRVPCWRDPNDRFHIAMEVGNPRADVVTGVVASDTWASVQQVTYFSALCKPLQIAAPQPTKG